ncbi:thiamine diphosphokinase [Pseudosulfitobacter koreensis]|uniref:Thiamine diphosphokinase n=1 Tax=Pseudosulfitobacter koreensis TaxID=2968472 RepID=A0ABT1YYJ3_9RHOB|nr:thiamine diphosphokinase [Pseudosulfitobacter koreense]
MTLLGGGSGTAEDVHLARTLAPLCVAADGGALLALQAGVMPDAVIGDFDSLPQDARAQIPPERLYHIAEQSSTDFDKALRSIAAPLVIAVGFTGARVDHQLAAFHVLMAHASRPCIVLGKHEVIFHCPPDLSLPVAAGDVVSLFPMRQVTGRSTGLQWPIDGLAFDPMRLIGTSNRATGPVKLWMDGPGMLCIAPRRILPALVGALI